MGLVVGSAELTHAAHRCPESGVLASQKWWPGVPSGRSKSRAGDLSGFQSKFVGLHVGFFGLPDKPRPCEINALQQKCRVCRVFMGVEGTRGCRRLLNTAGGEEDKCSSSKDGGPEIARPTNASHVGTTRQARGRG